MIAPSNILTTHDLKQHSQSHEAQEKTVLNSTYCVECTFFYSFSHTGEKEAILIQTHTDKNRAAELVFRIILMEGTKYTSDRLGMRVSSVYC